MRQTYLAIFLALSSFMSFADLEVKDATIRLLPPGVPNTAAYLEIKNTGDKDISIVGAESSIVDRIELHAHVMEGEVMSMVKQSEVSVGAGESLYFQPGGYHLMMFGLKRPLSKGESIDIQIVTNEGENLTFSAIVKEPSAQKNKHHHH
ncbi:copper chaperone PCu(A)C [Alteromonadaceae bacterium M269]|nr:copper chaperone PCu(A)C [Alteromonadaceae bacterium M269]